MSDDFRLIVEFDEDRHGLHFLGHLLGERDLEKDMRELLGDGVLVTRDGPRVFLYTATEKEAQAASKVLREVSPRGARCECLAGDAVASRQERWEDASKGLPRTAAEIETEHERWEEQQTRVAEARGYAEWEVRVDLASHGDAVEFEKRLEAEGIAPVTRRWRYILIGTATEDDAQALATRLQTEAPEGATVTAEPSATIEWELAGGNAFSLFGGFGPRR